MIRCFFILLFFPALASAIEIDVLLTNGTIYDGKSLDSRIGDIAINNGKILDLTKNKEVTAKLVIDCTGMIICPGFIDLHNHSDNQVTAAATRANINYLLQGCTTIVTGNCGAGPVYVDKYYTAINQAGSGTNVIHLLAQGNLRREIMGDERRKATSEEQADMLKLADKAMDDGAWGMSTGLIYVPSSYADTAEITAIASVVAKHGGIYVSHIRGEGSGLITSVNEAMQIGRDAKLPVHISHFKSSGRNNWGLVRVAAKTIQDARDDGQQVTADQYPYRASSTSLSATTIPTWARAGGRQAMIKRFDDPQDGPRIRTAIQAKLDRTDNGGAIRIARCYQQKWVGKSIAQIAKLENKPALEIIELIERNGGAGVVNFSMDPEDVRYVMSLPWVATASDGRAYLPGADKPHPRSYGTFPRKISLFAQQEEIISVGHAIRSATGLPAEILGLKDRGTLNPNMIADIVVYDPTTLQDKATFDDPHQYCVGIEYVFIGGKLAVYRGRPTGALHGRALKKPAR
tara:strand:- start:85 stop:1635 length:1551 start_codon:yes stop_codon:yes gene_type:complete